MIFLYFILFSGSRGCHNIYKLALTQGSLETTVLGRNGRGGDVRRKYPDRISRYQFCILDSVALFTFAGNTKFQITKTVYDREIKHNEYTFILTILIGLQLLLMQLGWA